MADELQKRLILDKYNRPVRCARCGGSMNYKGVGEFQCERCQYIDYDDYGIVRNYLEDHKGATTAEISAMTGISQRQINEMLRDEKFEITMDSKVFLKCKGCGKEIRSGMYCVECGKLASAAAAKKRAEQERKARQESMSITGTAGINTTDSGAKRFSRDR